MDYWLLGGMTLRTTIVVLMTLCEAAGSSAIAQTLIEPNSKPKVSQSSDSAKPQPALRSKSCSRFGAGFAQIPGTDTCVKIGGFVTIEGAVNHGR